jgi:hypothetical protein
VSVAPVAMLMSSGTPLAAATLPFWIALVGSVPAGS